MAAWFAGLTLFAIYFGYHWFQVTHHRLPTDLAHPVSWISFGGTAFLLSTTGFHMLLGDLPRWTWCIYLPLSVLGLSGWRGPMSQRTGLTAGAYLALFAVAGLPINNYWGFLIAPLLALGFVHAPGALRDLFTCLKGPTVERESTMI
jgi:hypothetical protein